MTKFKEYLMAHGAILERNSAELAQDENWDVEFIIPKVLDSGLAISYCHVDDHVPDVVVYDRSGACRYISRSEYQAHVGNRHHDPELMDWLYDNGFTDQALNHLMIHYSPIHSSYGVYVAFLHVRAGIMDEAAFYKLVSKRCQQTINFYHIDTVLN